MRVTEAIVLASDAKFFKGLLFLLLLGRARGGKQRGIEVRTEEGASGSTGFGQCGVEAGGVSVCC